MHVEAVLLFVLAAVAVVVVVRWVAERTGLPAAALLPMIGIVYSLLPGPNLKLDPDLILTFVLPPLLYSAARAASICASVPLSPHPVPSASPPSTRRHRRNRSSISRSL